MGDVLVATARLDAANKHLKVSQEGVKAARAEMLEALPKHPVGSRVFDTKGGKKYEVAGCYLVDTRKHGNVEYKVGYRLAQIKVDGTPSRTITDFDPGSHVAAWRNANNLERAKDAKTI